MSKLAMVEVIVHCAKMVSDLTTEEDTGHAATGDDCPSMHLGVFDHPHRLRSHPLRLPVSASSR